MIIEKEYVLTIDDNIIFQNFFTNKYLKQNSSVHWLIIYFPLIFILFSTTYIEDIIIKYMGIIISFSMFLYYILYILFSGKIRNNNIKKVYLKNFIPEKVKIIITEESITIFNEISENKYFVNWILNCENEKEYIYLISNNNSTIILPKKYFTDEDQENILKYYNKEKMKKSKNVI